MRGQAEGSDVWLHQQAALGWLAAQGERSGFTLLDTSVDADRQQQLRRKTPGNGSSSVVWINSGMLNGHRSWVISATSQSGVWQKPGVRLWSDADQTWSRGVTFVPLSPIPLKDRTSMIFLQYGQIDVLDGAFVLIDKTGIRTHIPVGSVACIMLEPGTRVSHAAVHLAATVGTLLVWVGEAGVRVSLLFRTTRWGAC